MSSDGMTAATDVRVLTVIDGIIRRLLLVMTLIGASFFAWSAIDMYAFSHHQAGREYHDMAELVAANPDAVAWIRLEGTRIDHPVVQGKDNFEYLSKDFNRLDYAGGSIFLDAGCDKDLSGNYLLIHGHNMSGGAMFGDLTKYTETEFFDEHMSGELFTAGGDYDLTVAGCSIEDAYHSDVYDVSPAAEAQNDAGYRFSVLKENCITERDVGFMPGDKLVALSTCSGDMSEKRTVVYCRARLRNQERNFSDEEESR